MRRPLQERGAGPDGAPRGVPRGTDFRLESCRCRSWDNPGYSAVHGQAGRWARTLINRELLVTFYSDDNFTGATLTTTADDASLVDDNWNDVASSLEVSAAGGSSFSTLVQAEAYSAMSGVSTEATTDTDGGSNVGYIETADWMAYNGITFPATGSYKIEYRVASLSGGGKLSVDLNAGATVLGTVDIPSTGGWQNWTTVTHTVSVTAGTYNVGIYAQAGGWNFNWFRITRL